uniref:Bacterial transcriptional activator domain-containing protein n=2 Tax=unclassified Mycobacterium TaxID=2642494 RepID=A0A5Q5BT34_MYCSS
MTSTAVSTAPVTSWWYGQGRAVDVVRRLESLYTLSPPPTAPAGLVTARRDELTVTFVAGLKSPLPHPWRPADSSNEARIPWEAVDPGNDPDPDRPVYLVVFGTTDDGGLIGLNLAAFQRIRFDGDTATATALVSRWVLELVSTHPDITIGVTADVWNGPFTTRVQPVAAGRVPQVDVLVCGPALTYTDRSQIVSSAASKIVIDLGKDAAVDARWTITCGPDRLGQISSERSARPMTATLIVPSAATVDRCAALLTDTSAQAAATPPDPTYSAAAPEAPITELPTADLDDLDDPATDPHLPIPSDVATLHDDGIDFFATQPAAAPNVGPTPQLQPAHNDPTDADQERDWPTDDLDGSTAAADVGRAELNPAIGEGSTPAADATAEPEPAAAPATAAPKSLPSDTADGAAPVVATIWNRILGQVALDPPHATQQPGPREKRLNELTVFLQHNPWVSATDIVRHIYGGVAADKTVTQQVSLLRARLGAVFAGGPKALPPMTEGGYHLDNAVRSDWMEFERLVEILPETTPTPNLVAAMDLVTGPPLGGIAPKEWTWTKDLRDELRDRVAGAAVVLARRHHSAKAYSAAVETARKGLWYDNARQDLWQIGMQAALDGHDKDAYKTLRTQYLAAVPGSERDPEVFDLTKRAG